MSQEKITEQQISYNLNPNMYGGIPPIRWHYLDISNIDKTFIEKARKIFNYEFHRYRVPFKTFHWGLPPNAKVGEIFLIKDSEYKIEMLLRITTIMPMNILIREGEKDINITDYQLLGNMCIICEPAA